LKTRNTLPANEIRKTLCPFGTQNEPNSGPESKSIKPKSNRFKPKKLQRHLPLIKDSAFICAHPPSIATPVLPPSAVALLRRTGVAILRRVERSGLRLKTASPSKVKQVFPTPPGGYQGLAPNAPHPAPFNSQPSLPLPIRAYSTLFVGFFAQKIRNFFTGQFFKILGKSGKKRRKKRAILPPKPCGF